MCMETPLIPTRPRSARGTVYSLFLGLAMWAMLVVLVVLVLR